MAGTIPLSLTQQFDEFGKPLAGGLLYIIQAGTVSTPQQPYQDYGLTILQPNPIPLDAAGRVPQFFLADGFIKFRLTNKVGVEQKVLDNVLVIGPSSGGGGGGGVDPTALIQTGDLKARYDTAALSGYVRANGRTIGNALSGATERANSDTQALWVFLYNVDGNLTVSGGRTGNALNDYNSNKQLSLPDWRGCVIAGLDDMGNAPSGRLTSAASGFGTSPIVLGAFGGAQSNTLDLGSMPSHAHSVFLTDPGHQHPAVLPPGEGGASIFGLGFSGGNTFASGGTAAVDLSGVLTGRRTTGITINNGGGTNNVTANNGAGNPHQNVQPSRLCTIYLKL